jgi:hypothetical protein
LIIIINISSNNNDENNIIASITHHIIFGKEKSLSTSSSLHLTFFYCGKVKGKLSNCLARIYLSFRMKCYHSNQIPYQMVDVWVVLAGVRMNSSLLNDVKYSAIDIAEAEEPMTIVVRIKSSDGIVLASDSQFTAMYGKI